MIWCGSTNTLFVKTTWHYKICHSRTNITTPQSCQRCFFSFSNPDLFGFGNFCFQMLKTKNCVKVINQKVYLIWCCGKRQKLTIYWTSWLWRIACNYLRIIVQRNTISATYSVSCCKISAIFCRVMNTHFKIYFERNIKKTQRPTIIQWLSGHFKIMFQHVFLFAL